MHGIVGEILGTVALGVGQKVMEIPIGITLILPSIIVITALLLNMLTVEHGIGFTENISHN
jgi:hypothetical protein